jgi:hypothetical protein
MALADLRARARAYATGPATGTPGTPGRWVGGSGQESERSPQFPRVSKAGTLGTPKHYDVPCVTEGFRHAAVFETCVHGCEAITVDVSSPSIGPNEPAEIPAGPCPNCRQSIWWQLRSGVSWRCDICDPHPDGWPPARTIDLAERRGSEAELSLPAIGTAERAQLAVKHGAMLAGLVAASLKRPPSWWHPEPHNPTQGATCTCCAGRAWWTRDRLGWCCATCHPTQGCERIVVQT